MDNGGTLGGGVDTSAPQSVTITVTPVNDAPSFTAGAPQTVVEDAPAQTVTGWATAISPGPPDEAAQTVAFVVTPDAPALFSVAPAISPTGDLTFTPAPNATGTATLTVVAQDTGGTANGGVNVSPAQTVTITIAAVNDVPVLDLDADDSGGTTGANFAVTFTENGPVTLLEDATDATIGDLDNTTLSTLTVTLTNLLDAGVEQLAVDLTGFPTFAAIYDTTTTPGQGILTLAGTGGPEPIAAFQDLLRRVTYQHTGDNPTATARVITFSAFDGAAASNTATSTVTVVPVNDPPTAVADAFAVNEGGTVSPPAPGVLANDTDPDTPPASFVVSLVSGPANAAAFTLNPDGSFTYTHNGVDTPADTFTYTVSDGTAPSSVATVTITITNANEPPIAVADVGTTNEDTALTVPLPGVLANDLDPDLGDIKVVVAVNGNPALVGVNFFSGKGGVLVNADGSFLYDPTSQNVLESLGAGQTDTDTFTYTMRDAGGLLSDATVTITVTGVNDVPTLDLDFDDDGGTPPTTGTGFAIPFTEGGPPQLIQDEVDAVIFDVDSPTLTTLTVTITNVLDPLQERLDVDLVTGGFDATFTKSFDETTTPGVAVLTLTATTPQPIASFNTLLRRVTYQNLDPAPDVSTPRTITFVVSDGAATSAPATTTVTITAADDPPTADNDSYSVAEGGTLNMPAPGVLDGDSRPRGRRADRGRAGGRPGQRLDVHAEPRRQLQLHPQQQRDNDRHVHLSGVGERPAVERRHRDDHR